MLNAFLRLTSPFVSLVISVLVAWIWHSYNMPGLPKVDPGLTSVTTAMGVLAQIAATMLGFMMAVLAILASIANTRLVRNMQRSGHFHQMLVRIFVDNIGFACLTLVALGISFRPDKVLVLAPWVVGITMFSATLFVSSLVMLWQTLANLKPSSPQIE